MNRPKNLRSRLAALAACACAAVLGLATSPEVASSHGAGQPTVATPSPLSKVSLALKGCTSCAHCRTTIRQMAKASAKDADTRVSTGQVEVVYKSPRVVPLRDVIRTLAENRLHDLDLVDVLFEARGTIEKRA